MADAAEPAILTAPDAGSAAARARLKAWLIDHGGHRSTALDLLGELGPRLVAAGLPIWRVACFLTDFHPEYVGRQYSWQQGKGPEQIDRLYTPIRSQLYLLNPIRVIHDGAAALRRRLEGPGAVLDFPVLHELAADGVTDYLALPLVFSDGSRQFISFATIRAGGFRPDELAFLDSLMALICLRFEVEHARQIADQMLGVYLGSYAAPRVIGGQIRRERGAAIQAIILAVDMRGFTHLTDTLNADAVFAALSIFYDAVAGPVIAGGGDVVKMIADGILAVFPVADGRAPSEIAAVAAKATRMALASLAMLAPEDLPDGAWPLRAGFALHAGPVTFGNVGSRSRLDFTLIGPAVNEAFRIEALTKETGHPILASAPFAALLAGEVLQSAGHHALKGVTGTREVFALPARPARGAVAA